MSDRSRHALARAIHALAALTIAAPLAFAALAALPTTTRADGLTMTAHALLHGRTRAGAWFGIAVDIGNPGPAVTGELRVQGGTDGRTRFGQLAELATGSRKEFLLFAQPPGFGNRVTVDLTYGDRVVASVPVDITAVEPGATAVGVLADNAAKLVGEISLPPSAWGVPPALVPLTVADLPERVQAWATLDRLVWQDVDAASLSKGQLASLRAWVAAGGRLVIAGGTRGADSLAGLPDDLLPYRPTATLDIDPAVLRPVLGGTPTGSSILPALAGTLAHGRSLATSGDRTVAADMPYGAGWVTLLGFDPTTPWLAKGDTWDAPLWRRLLPSRSGGTPVAMVDDSNLVNATANLPSGTLPSTGGLLILLVAYIVLVGPVNYVVLRLLDRREWAWATVPALIAAFTAAAFGYGLITRGSDVVVHEVAIVRGAPGTDQATAQSWLAIFSPSRTSFQVSTPGETLLSAPMMTNDLFGQGPSSAMDVLEGDPTRIRDLAVGYGSVRTIRAEGRTAGPVVNADLRLEGSTIRGAVTNSSSVTLASSVLVLGSSVARLGDIAPGASAQVILDITPPDQNGFMQLSDRLVGFMDWGGTRTDEAQRMFIRRAVIDQLSYDPNGGMAVALPGASLTLLAWGTDPVFQLEIQEQDPHRTTDVLYDIPVRVAVTGPVRFSGDLLPGTMTSQTSFQGGKDPTSLVMDTGTMTMAYRPMPFDGTLAPTSVTFALGSGGFGTVMPGGRPVEATIGRCDPSAKACTGATMGFPDVDVLDVRSGEWVELDHLTTGAPYSLPDPARWVDPTTGEVQVRFVNQGQGTIAFQFPIAVEGTVR